MAKGGFRGPMGGGMNMNMIKQAQKMQQDMLKMQEELEVKQYEAAAGGGVVKAVVNGKHEVVSLTIDPEAVDPEDVEMLQDMVVAAVNEAMRKAEARGVAEYVPPDRRPESRRPVLMRVFPAALERLTEQFAKLPGHRRQDGAAAGVLLTVPAAGGGGGIRRRPARGAEVCPPVPRVPEPDGSRRLPHLRG